MYFKAGEKPDHGKEAAAQLCASVYKPSPWQPQAHYKPTTN